jgi:peptidoglycan L-alanyl-D-glutamate endopeptidase CwlK
MSAGAHGEYPGEPPIEIIASLEYLAPAMHRAVTAALAECHDVGLDAVVHESQRSNATQAIYYARGRTQIPPHRTVTNARSNQFSWHGYGLAVDVISKSKGWDAGELWFKLVAAIFKKHGCKWGGDWLSPDLPHMQWGKCKPSPSPLARALLKSGGIPAVWREVGAL